MKRVAVLLVIIAGCGGRVDLPSYSFPRPLNGGCFFLDPQDAGPEVEDPCEREARAVTCPNGDDPGPGCFPHPTLPGLLCCEGTESGEADD